MPSCHKWVCRGSQRDVFDHGLIVSKGAEWGRLPLLCTRRQFCGRQKNAAVGRKIFPADVHDLTLGTSEYIIDMARGTLQMWLRLRTSRCGDYLGLSGWTNLITWVLKSGGGGRRQVGEVQQCKRQKIVKTWEVLIHPSKMEARS